MSDDTGPLVMDGEVGLATGFLPLFALILLLSLSALVYEHRDAGAIVWTALAFMAPTICWIAMLRRRLTIDDQGLSVRRLFGTRRMSWDDVSHYRYTALSRRSVTVATGAIVGGPVGLVAAGALNALRKPRRETAFAKLRIVDRSGHEIVIDRRYAELPRGIERCFAALHPRLGNQFSPLELHDDTLVHSSGKTLAIGDIDRVTVTSGWLRVMARGQRLAWHGGLMSSTQNSMRLVELLAGRGVPIDVAPGVFVPLSTRIVLASTGTVPEARVVQR